METFGERLKRLRLRNSLGVRQLEDMAGLPHGVISRVEKGGRKYTSIPHAMKLARVLGVTMDYLCGMNEHWDIGKEGDGSKAA